MSSSRVGKHETTNELATKLQSERKARLKAERQVGRLQAKLDEAVLTQHGLIQNYKTLLRAYDEVKELAKGRDTRAEQEIEQWLK